MTPSEKRTTTEDRFRNHRFPALEDASSDSPGGSRSLSGSFQPLYDCDQSAHAYRPSGILSLDTEHQSNENSEERKQECYCQGIQAGEKDAQCLLKEEMNPSLQGFVQAVNQLRGHLLQITESSSQNIIALALEIVHRILGHAAALPDTHMNAIGQDVLDAMSRAYSINLMMNDEELAHLTELIQCDASVTLNDDAVRLKADDRLPKGSISRGDGMQGLALEPITQRLSDLLDHP